MRRYVSEGCESWSRFLCLHIGITWPRKSQKAQAHTYVVTPEKPAVYTPRFTSWGFPLNHGPWSPHTNPLGKGGPARGPWKDFEEEISEEEVAEMREDFPDDEVVDDLDDLDEGLDDLDEDAVEPVAAEMPVGHSGRTVILWACEPVRVLQIPHQVIPSWITLDQFLLPTVFLNYFPGFSSKYLLVERQSHEFIGREGLQPGADVEVSGWPANILATKEKRAGLWAQQQCFTHRGEKIGPQLVWRPWWLLGRLDLIGGVKNLSKSIPGIRRFFLHVSGIGWNHQTDINRHKQTLKKKLSGRRMNLSWQSMLHVQVRFFIKVQPHLGKLDQFPGWMWCKLHQNPGFYQLLFRWGLLDFMSAGRPPPLPPPPPLHPPPPPAPARSQCSPPDRYSNVWIKVFPAGPPPQAPDQSVPAGPQPRGPDQSFPRRTSTTKNCWRYTR